jgi:hypothetical protein
MAETVSSNRLQYYVKITFLYVSLFLTGTAVIPYGKTFLS